MSTKVHRPIFEAMPVALNDIFNEKYHADKVIERQLKLHKKWGSRDRKIFAETIYSIVRNWRRYVVMAGLQWSDEQDINLTEELIYKILFIEFKAQELLWPNWLKEPTVHPKSLDFADQQSIPDWLNQLGEQQFGPKWSELITGLNQQAKIYLRANTLKVTAAELVKTLFEEGVEAHVVGAHAVCLNQRANVFRTKAFKLGLFEVQDYGSQMIAEFVDPQSKERIWDACAGAGGKALAMACMMENKGKIIASDIHEWKLKELKKRAKRNSIDVIETRVIDSKMIKRMQGKIDKLLLDVPCSGLGVLRRNPDTKWKMTPQRISELQELQKDILEKYSVTVKPEGSMVYATCSFLESENMQQVQGFLEQNADWKLESSKSILPQDYDCDAFFMAKLRRLK
ncbi:MAG: class I SAM-dependent methyltransferase [Bdellovibrionales bacterium]|nr:class I SAM-dependent methyltransferase [Bdellovibrionales bacterium]